jgi:hypothetical protein
MARDFAGAGSSARAPHRRLPRKPSPIVSETTGARSGVASSPSPHEYFSVAACFSFLAQSISFASSDGEAASARTSALTASIFFSRPLLRPPARRTLMFVDPQAAHVFSPTAANTP